uniref:SAP domain-containing protein n=1 Tax=uncultured marine group II/III euryarchaeote KM3_53_G07 TaxID=1456458 RepID=A0A075HDB6_9EURY|nr:hypothetical protein [uncultured marine group II/III euryarchaeote KM3_53_G07]
MAGDEVESDNSNDLPLDDSVYISEEEDTMEKMKRGFKKIGKDLKKGAEDLADSSKKFASKSKEKYDAAREERKKAKAMKDPLNFPWSNLSVVELKDNLKSLGLKVSGKKDDLIERILEHYRTEIPEMEDGTPHLIEDLEPLDENPPAPDIDELIEEQEEVVEELSPTFEEVDPETPVVQFEGSEQMYVYDPVINTPKRAKTVQNNNWRAKKIISTINVIFGGLILLLMLSVWDYGFDMGIFGNDDNLINWFAQIFGVKLLRPYGGMSELEVGALAGSLSIMLFMSSMLFFTRRHPKAAGAIVNLVLITSLGVRIYAGGISNSFENIDMWGYLIFDLMFIIPFSFTCWVPAMVVSEITYSRQSSPESFQVSDDPSFSDETPQSITDTTSDEQLGEDMGRFDVTKPEPPKRRKIGQGSMYETLFLFASLVAWPFTICMTALLILGIHSDTFNVTFSMDEHNLLLIVLYAFSFFCSYIVYRIDKEARSGEIYAKVKLAYHRDMDQYLELKRVYYENEAARIAGENGNNGDE